MTLSTLKQRYLAPHMAYDEVTEVEFLIDGATYLQAISDEITQTQSGDAVLPRRLVLRTGAGPHRPPARRPRARAGR